MDLLPAPLLLVFRLWFNALTLEASEQSRAETCSSLLALSLLLGLAEREHKYAEAGDSSTATPPPRALPAAPPGRLRPDLGSQRGQCSALGLLFLAAHGEL